MNKTPSNAPAIQSLKDNGFDVRIQHYRRVPVFGMESNKWEKQVVPDFEWRKFLFTGYYDLPDENGGATELTVEKDAALERDKIRIVVRADCYYKDRFCRRTGVSQCLKKLESLYGIK